MRTPKRKSRILSEVHETARGLQRIGLLSKKQMVVFDALCHVDDLEMSPKQIKKLREKEQLSLEEFAAVLNTSVSTVQKWEAGDKRPSGPSLKLLSIIDRKGLDTVL